jgi:hypothetical protein
MESALANLIARYNPPLSQNDITTIFRNAQKDVLDAIDKGTKDCPRGTQKESEVKAGASMAATDGTDWKGTAADSGRMHLQALLELTLYYFDKYLYAFLSGTKSFSLPN